jgi:hypothetical protein
MNSFWSQWVALNVVQTIPQMRGANGCAGLFAFRREGPLRGDQCITKLDKSSQTRSTNEREVFFPGGFSDINI